MIRITRLRKTGQVRVTWALPSAEPDGPVSVVGCFNDWTPGVHVLEQRTNGTRSVSWTMPAGDVIRFRYLGADGRWFDDPDATERDGDNGMIVATL